MKVRLPIRLHVVGPGRSHQVPITQDEVNKHARLVVETFALDFLLPLVMEANGRKSKLAEKDIKVAPPALEKFIAQTELLLKAVPEVYDLLAQGKYTEGTKKAVESLYKSGTKKYLKELSLLAYALMEIGGVPNPIDETKATKLANRTAAILKIIDTAMLGGDFIRISTGIADSRALEDWTIKARSSKVTIHPEVATVQARRSKELEAIVKNIEKSNDTHPFFVWKTAGKYGQLWGGEGEKGTTIETKNNKIRYFADVRTADLPEENNWDYVYVEAFLGSQSIGMDTLAINIRKSDFEIKPKGVTLSGKKEGNANSVKLHIESTDNSMVDFSDKKVVWSTDGKYGLLQGDGGFATTITTYGANSIQYECTDEDTEKGTEKVYARVYEKSAVDNGSYYLSEELETTLEINNEDNIKIFYVSYSVKTWENITGSYSNCGAGTVFYIDPVPNAERYTATVIEFSPEFIPRVTGRTDSWLASEKPNEDGKYEFASVGSGAISYPTWMGPQDCTSFTEQAASRTAIAKVIIELKD